MIKVLRLLSVLWILTQVKGEGGCRDLKFLKCIENKTLTGHVISTIKMMTPVLQLCQNKCFREHKCVSYNLGSVLGQTRSCELNVADHSTRPSFLVSKTGYEYCPIQNPCMSNPCSPGRLCTLDFAWNTYNCDDGGWTQWSPWMSSIPSMCCVQNRARSCTSPPPLNKGADCVGFDKEIKTCKSVPIVDISGCKDPLGMEDGRIKDEQINASSYTHSSRDTFHGPWNGRLNKVKDSKGISGWATPKIGEYIQIDLRSVKVITMVATQGRSSEDWIQYVTKYSLAYSIDGNDWKDYYGDYTKVFSGNYDRNTVVTNELEVPIKTRYIRLIVKGFIGHATMRIEFYGCNDLPTL